MSATAYAPRHAVPTTRRDTLSVSTFNSRAGQLSVLGTRVVFTDWKGANRVGVLELDPTPKTGHKYLVARFADGTWARVGRKLRVVVTP